MEKRPERAPQQLPPQTANAARLWRDLADSEVRWIRETIEIVERDLSQLGFADASAGQGAS